MFVITITFMIQVHLAQIPSPYVSLFPNAHKYPNATIINTYWYGPVNEILLLCWYSNLANPYIRQIFYLDDATDWEIYTNKYYFMSQLETKKLDWEDFLTPIIEFNSPIKNIIQNYTPNQKSDIFRYVIIARNLGSYGDADQCIFNPFFKDKNIFDSDFLVVNNNNDITSGIFYFGDEIRNKLLSISILNDFKPDGRLILYDNLILNEKLPWDIVGQSYLVKILNENNLLDKDDKILSRKLIFIPSDDMYGNLNDNLNFCEIWNKQTSKIGVHFMSKVRETYRKPIMELFRETVSHQKLQFIIPYCDF